MPCCCTCWRKPSCGSISSASCPTRRWRRTRWRRRWRRAGPRPGFGIRAAAAARGLGFVPLLRERFDLVMDRRTYFEAPVQALLGFARGPAFAARAGRMGGYDTTGTGASPSIFEHHHSIQRVIASPIQRTEDSITARRMPRAAAWGGTSASGSPWRCPSHAFGLRARPMPTAGSSAAPICPPERCAVASDRLLSRDEFIQM